MNFGSSYGNLIDVLFWVTTQIRSNFHLPYHVVQGAIINDCEALSEPFTLRKNHLTSSWLGFLREFGANPSIGTIGDAGSLSVLVRMSLLLLLEAKDVWVILILWDCCWSTAKTGACEE
ncbi:hypothetical protein AVEN_161612-1 [Araneus ventricosus]|uniref:Uncharacterized protein n=1 Tax=Araneus ventricosus TaxID=182803 RepID=A0A4Y2FQL9_ARAVE|nr:hypothetical protein AVEN_161612-1 [Araneus ventricosus]